MTAYLESKFTCGSLRRKFINNEMPSYLEFTGDSIGKMLAELRQEKKISNPYNVQTQKIADETKKIIGEMRRFVVTIEGMYKVDNKLPYAYRFPFESTTSLGSHLLVQKKSTPSRRNFSLWPQTTTMKIIGTPIPLRETKDTRPS